jgi:hypothetical protein
MTYVPSSRIKYAGFRDGDHDYVLSQRHWKRLFESVVGTRYAWQPWLKDHFRQGQPIFSRVSKQLSMGVVINQVLPSDDSLTFRAWMSVFGSKEYNDEVTTLNITCMPVDETDSLVKALLREFIVHRRTCSSMEHLCAELTRSSKEIVD